jgi:2-dehydro-3-deoxyphosphogluconate aldolase/(4S)-4-hydroxy-2-oxoglutarate aldolase
VNLDHFRRLPILGILRGGDTAIIDDLVETVITAGLRTLEITMNTPDAPALIRRAIEVSAGRLTIGAGTVLSSDDLAAARAAGASFVVMPTLVEEVAAECRKSGVAMFPGALTPQEIHNAWTAGAAMVKVFPARVFGPAYFKEIKGPFDGVDLLACGGVDPGNVAAYFDCGASAIAFGGGVFKPEWMAAREFDRIGAAARDILEAYRQWAGGTATPALS